MIGQPILWIIGWLIHVVTVILVTFHCLKRQRNASATILWIALAWSFPGIGPLIYLSFGIDRVKDRGFEKFMSDQKLLSKREKSAPYAYWHSTPRTTAQSEFQRELDRVLDALIPEHPPLDKNQIRPLVGGDEAYPEMLEAIRSAKSHIHLQSFIIGKDQTGTEFMEALAQKAAEGVEVRLLYDRFGSTKAFLGGLFRKHSGIKNFQIAGWTQANPLKRQFQINLRNHRKTLVVDGHQAFFGGINLHDENTSAHPNGPIRDYHFSLRGPIVQELQYAFLRDWHFITAENPADLLHEKFFPKQIPEGEAVARLLSSGPVNEKEVAVETFFSAISLAKQQILAVTPYFVPPPDILRALRSAALRGLDVRLIVPKKNNHFYAGFASRSLYTRLLLAGVKIYERNPPFMHAKALVIDSSCALVGTANLDQRSLNLNYETTAIIHGAPFADRMKEIIHEDISRSTEISLSEWSKRSASRRLLENLANLMSPVL